MWFKMIKKILFLGAVLPLCVFASHVKAYEVRDFVYELHGNKAKITDYVGTQTSISIPSYLDGFEVTVIGQNALNNKGLSSVSLPSTLLIVEDSAFANNLITSISFPGSVLEVQSNAFMNNRIVTLNLPSTLKVVGDSAFSQNRLKIIDYNEQETQVDLTAFETANEYLFHESWPFHLYYNVINDEVHIWGWTSWTCNLSFPNELSYTYYASYFDVPVVAIHGKSPSASCTGNLTIELPESLRYIGKNAFKALPSNSVVFSFNSNSIEHIGAFAFSELSLTSFSIPGSVKYIGEGAFSDNYLTEVIIPNSVKEISEKAFFQNVIQWVQLGNNIEIISDSAFENNKISSLVIPDSVQTIGDYAFKSNYISELNFEQSQADIGVEAFRDNHISQVTIPETIGEIASDAFYGNQITDVNYLGGGAEFYFIGDSDLDGVFDILDPFPFDDTEFLDTDSDGIGNNADTDDDNDGYTDFLDAFPTDSTEWSDSDLDGIGNNADLDDDNDGVADTEDAFPHTASESLDSDNDGVGDNADAFPNDATEVADTDIDGIGNNADPDDDNDGVADADDVDPLNADIGIQPSQLISVAGNPVGVNGHSTRISLGYDTSNGNNQLPGIGFRVHYSSEMLSFAGTENTIENDIIVNGDGPYQDDSDFDNDLNTDKYIIFGWAALNGDWPNSSLPTSLADVVFNVSWEAFDQASITTPINFSKVSTTEGYNFEATNYTLNVLPATWDFDGNGQADALTDGLILLRYLFGVSGSSLTNGVMSPNSTMMPSEVEVAVEKAQVIADVDGDENVDALTDGMILLRYMFGLSAENLVDGVVSANATRASAESVQQHIELYMPNNLLPPVQSEQSFIVGDWKLAGVPDKREYEEGALQDWNFYGSAYSQAEFDNCVADDIYRFGENGTFKYLINGSTYIDEELNPLYDWNDFTSSSCVSPLAPWNEDQIYTYSIDQNNSLLTVNGYGAYIALAHVANGTDDLENAADAPESISYDFTKLSDTELLLEIDAYDDFYRFTLEKVVD